MQIAFEIIHYLKDGKFHSGVELAQRVRVGRTSVWKAIHYLQGLGLSIDAVHGRGYRLTQSIVFLEKSKIVSEISPDNQAKIHQMDVLPAVTSTNDYLWAHLPYGQKPFSFCLSESQTQGKGRQGKTWHSPFGRNLYLSFYSFFSSAQPLSGLSLVMGMSVLKTIQAFSPLPEGFGIKWPNDILFLSRKVGGILIETQQSQHEMSNNGVHVVIGIGLNFDLSGYTSKDAQWTDICSALGATISRNAFSGKLINTLIEDFELFSRHGFDYFYPFWSQYDLLKDKQIQILTHQMVEEGRYCGINKRGELLVNVQGTLKAITYGDISIKIQ